MDIFEEPTSSLPRNDEEVIASVFNNFNDKFCAY